ncbi:MAG: Rieske 2Fe-2S domain-containing protein [Deltaproteobacteria bacterium]|nr:Rieske 2Fe-2S domain-containing protein [Deltaproteobacteria bacterium]
MRYDASIEDDRIHTSLYTDPHIFAEELEKIFYRGWVFVGRESEVPQPGDFVTRPIGRQPVIMVRGKDQKVAVLLNRCAHRGTTVCPAEQPVLCAPHPTPLQSRESAPAEHMMVSDRLTKWPGPGCLRPPTRRCELT